jgi:hypothetical protein
MMKKFNIIDIIFIIVVVGLISVAFLKTSKYNVTKTSSTMNKIEYSLTVRGVRSYTKDAFKVGDTVFDTQTKVIIGTIKDIKVEDNEVYVESITGKLLKANIPGRYNVTLTIDTDGLETEKAFFADRSVELKVGSEKTFETLYVKTNGTVMSVKTIG